MTGSRIALALLAVFLIPAPAWSGSAATPDTGDVLAVITTKAGPLKLIQKDGGRFFLFNGRSILNGSRYLDVYKFLRPPRAYDALMVKDFSGPVYCPLQYRLVVIKPDGECRIFMPFNHCADKPETRLDGSRVFITFNAFGEQPAVRYVFDGRKLMAAGQASAGPPDSDNILQDNE